MDEVSGEIDVALRGAIACDFLPSEWVDPIWPFITLCYYVVIGRLHQLRLHVVQDVVVKLVIRRSSVRGVDINPEAINGERAIVILFGEFIQQLCQKGKDGHRKVWREREKTCSVYVSRAMKDI